MLKIMRYVYTNKNNLLVKNKKLIHFMTSNLINSVESIDTYIKINVKGKYKDDKLITFLNNYKNNCSNEKEKEKEKEDIINFITELEVNSNDLEQIKYLCKYKYRYYIESYFLSEYLKKQLGKK